MSLSTQIKNLRQQSTTKRYKQQSALKVAYMWLITYFFVLETLNLLSLPTDHCYQYPIQEKKKSKEYIFWLELQEAREDNIRHVKSGTCPCKLRKYQCMNTDIYQLVIEDFIEKCRMFKLKNEKGNQYSCHPNMHTLI